MPLQEVSYNPKRGIFYMNRLCCIFLAILFLPGCWMGGPVEASRIAYRHDAVKWVYQAGGQVGRWGVLLVPVENQLLDLQPGDGCVHVREGQASGQCSAAPQGDLQLSHALNPKTGRSVLSSGLTVPMDHPKAVRDADNRGWTLPIDAGLSVYSFSGRLHLRLPSDMLVLHLKHPDPEVTYEPHLGVPIAAFRMSDHLLIIGLDGGYVVCVDLKGLRAESSAQTRLPHKAANNARMPGTRAGFVY